MGGLSVTSRNASTNIWFCPNQTSRNRFVCEFGTPDAEMKARIQNDREVVLNMSNIDIAIPNHKFRSFKDEIMTTWFRGNEALLTLHRRRHPGIFTVCSFESEDPYDIGTVRAICARHHARVLSVV